MQCKKVQELLLSDYTDEELAAGPRQSLQRHLDSCAACRAYRAQLDAVRAPLRSARPIVPPERVWEEVSRRIDVPQRAPVFAALEALFGGLKRLLLPHPAFTFSGAAVLAVFVVFLLVVQPWKTAQVLMPRTGEDAASGMVLGEANGDLQFNFETAVEEFFL